MPALTRITQARCPCQVQCVPHFPVIYYVLAERFYHFEELKKDPGVPRLPSLKVRNAGKEKLHGVCLILPLKWPQCLTICL